ncbi:MAG: chromate resistance protein [Alphaproteobacteria bacterium]
MGDFFISIPELMTRIGTPGAPMLIDARRASAYAEADRILPAALWRDNGGVDAWAPPAGTEVVVYCVHGHNVSQSTVTQLRARGVRARTLAGGIEGWIAAGGPTILKAPRAHRWVTRMLPKIDRIACPWFIRRFVDPTAKIMFVEGAWVGDVATEFDAVPFDIVGVDFSHDGDKCSFDAFLDRFGIDDSALNDLALIVRGADTGRPDLAPEAAGLLAVSLGISAMAGGDDEAALQRGFAVYDALYAWRRHAAKEAHGWPPAAAA